MEDYIHRIINLFQERIGMNPDSLSHERLIKSIHERMKNLDIGDAAVYYKIFASSQTEFQALVELIVVPETWFFRDRNVFDFLSSGIKQVWLENSRKVRILSLACASGEEPYSIAIELFLSGLDAAFFEIDAVDISEKALKKAQEGTYNKNSFRETNPILLHRFFTQKGKNWEVTDLLRAQVKFIHSNLFNRQLSQEKLFYDIIFCRNLLIYLNSDAQFKLLKVLDQLLVPGKGILIVGSVEGELVRKFGYIHHSQTHAPVFLKQAFSETQSETNSVNLTKIFPRSLAEARDLMESGDFEQALSICHTLLEEAKDDPSIYYLIGLIELSKKNPDKAENNFKKTLYLQPDHYEALTRLEFLETERGNIARAELFHQRRKKIEEALKLEDKISEGNN